MLNTVRMLRRLLRNAFLVTNRVNVIGELQRKPEVGHRRWARPSAPRIDEGVRYRQPGRIEYLNPSKSSDPQDSPLHALYFRGAVSPTSGDRHQGGVTNVTPGRT